VEDLVDLAGGAGETAPTGTARETPDMPASFLLFAPAAAAVVADRSTRPDGAALTFPPLLPDSWALTIRLVGAPPRSTLMAGPLPADVHCPTAPVTIPAASCGTSSAMGVRTTAGAATPGRVAGELRFSTVTVTTRAASGGTPSVMGLRMSAGLVTFRSASEGVRPPAARFPPELAGFRRPSLAVS